MVLRLVVLLLALLAPAVRADPDDASSSRFDRLRDIDTGVQQDAGDDDETKGLYGGDEDADRENDPFADDAEPPEPETPTRSAEPTPARRPLGSPRPSEVAPTMDRGGGGAAGSGAAKPDAPTAPRGRAGAPPPTDQPRDDDGGPEVPIRGGRGGTTSGD